MHVTVGKPSGNTSSPLTANLGFSVHFSKFFLRKLDAGPLTRCKIASHEGRKLQI